MVRQKLIDGLLWHRGWDGYASSSQDLSLFMASVLFRSKTVRSVVVIGVDAETQTELLKEQARFTDVELECLSRISQKATENHIEVCGSVLNTDNLITIRRIEDDYGKVSWIWCRRTWTTGPSRAESLEQLEKDVLRKPGEKRT